jgi:integrase
MRPRSTEEPYGGPRISELVELRWRFVHLGAARLWVADAKTETGRREVQLSPVFVEALVAHRQQLLALRVRRPGVPVAGRHAPLRRQRALADHPPGGRAREPSPRA